jgi:hypothetical protein
MCVLRVRIITAGITPIRAPNKKIIVNQTNFLVFDFDECVAPLVTMRGSVSELDMTKMRANMKDKIPNE